MGSEDVIPPDSVIAQGPQGWQRLLLNPMEDASSVGIGAWKLKETYVAPAENVEPRLGRTALTFGAKEAAKAARLPKIAALRKYLFDFGSLENVGCSNIEGHRSDYVPVLASTVWEEARGYGFDKPAFRDEDRLWMKNQKLDRDSSRVRDHVFQFRVAPGEYELTMNVVPFSEQGKLRVTGVEGGPLTLPVRKKSPVTTARIKVTGEQPVIGIRIENDYGHFHWVSCVETLR